jgi:hypothetical protein
MDSGSDCYAHAGHDTKNKTFSLSLSFFWERLILSRHIYVQACTCSLFSRSRLGYFERRSLAMSDKLIAASRVKRRSIHRRLPISCRW